MKKMILPALIIASMILMPACNNNSGAEKGNTADPKEVLQAFFNKMVQTDFDGAAEFATQSSKPTLDLMKQMIKTMESRMQEGEIRKGPSEKFGNLEIGEAKIDGDNAFVPCKDPSDSIVVDFPLKKENGAWKVDFSIATMMKMGFEQAKKRRLINDSIKLEDIRDKMKEGMQMRDSMMKKMGNDQMN